MYTCEEEPLIVENDKNEPAATLEVPKNRQQDCRFRARKFFYSQCSKQ